MSQLFQDANWPRASAWLADQNELQGGKHIAVLGVPLTLGSITPSRCDLAPDAVRQALQRYSTYDVDASRELRDLAVRDLGNLEVSASTIDSASESIESAVRSALTSATALIILGGDNSITRPGVRGMANPLKRSGLLTFDAHFDLRDTDRGLTNGNPVRALLEDGLPGLNIVQIGIQPFANSGAYTKVATDAGITFITVDQVMERGISNVVADSLNHLNARCDVIYVDLDLDVMDRGFAPATAGSRPGGLLPREIRAAARACGSHPKVRIMDLVEMDPTRDINDVTTLAAAACLLSFASGVLGRSGIR